jgi:hypothetical protein
MVLRMKVALVLLVLWCSVGMPSSMNTYIHGNLGLRGGGKHKSKVATEEPQDIQAHIAHPGRYVLG